MKEADDMSDEDKIPTAEEAGNVWKEVLEDAAKNPTELRKSFDDLINFFSSIANDETAMETLREQIVKHYGE